MCITIIEARQLAGLNMDPVVCVQVGLSGVHHHHTLLQDLTQIPPPGPDGAGLIGLGKGK